HRRATANVAKTRATRRHGNLVFRSETQEPADLLRRLREDNGLGLVMSEPFVAAVRGPRALVDRDDFISEKGGEFGGKIHPSTITGASITATRVGCQVLANSYSDGGRMV